MSRLVVAVTSVALIAPPAQASVPFQPTNGSVQAAVKDVDDKKQAAFKRKLTKACKAYINEGVPNIPMPIPPTSTDDYADYYQSWDDLLFELVQKAEKAKAPNKRAAKKLKRWLDLLKATSGKWEEIVIAGRAGDSAKQNTLIEQSNRLREAARKAAKALGLDRPCTTTVP